MMTTSLPTIKARALMKRNIQRPPIEKFKMVTGQNLKPSQRARPPCQQKSQK